MIRVLLVEDNPGDAAIVAAVLSRASGPAFHLEHVTRLAQAEASLRAAPPDVVLLDMNLPDGRGPEILERVLAASPRTPVLAMSGFEDEKAAAASLEAGARAYLVKGAFDRAMLLDVILKLAKPA